MSASSDAAATGTTRQIECYVAQGPGQQLERWSYEVDAAPGPKEVDVEITHCGVCHSDVHQIDDAWGVACFPLVPGHEIVGHVAAVGSETLGFKVGDRVAIGVQRGSCGTCGCCKAGVENTCAKILKTYAGPGQDKGGFARAIRFPSGWVFKCPGGLSSEHAGPLMCAGITVFAPLKRFLLQSAGGAVGKKVGIIGIGGLGHIALQFAAKMGAHVVALSRSAAKEEEAMGFGAAEVLITRNSDAMREAACSFDFLLNTVSGTADLDEYLALLRPRGAMACVGLPEKTEKSRMFLHSVVLQERVLAGSYLGPYADYAEMLEFACANDIKPMIELFPKEQLNEAVLKVRENTARYRCVIQMSGEWSGAKL